ncbi:Holliday junction branch migration protein RuvA [Salibacteraceae bacterium]|jgi:Holliday junction DNA helicase RuvA|nr:Holliday junction branch migration protein RuvA [Salibacteraceae bacterium]
MYEYFKGRLIEKNPAYLVVECGGVGYYLNISLNTYEKLGKEESVRVYVYQHVREDNLSLYGFAEKGEREVFLKLISVSGVGTSTAQVMLSSLGPLQLQEAILDGDVSQLKSIKGIGAKTAERIIIDLRDKMAKDLPELEKSLFKGNTGIEEALSALVALGFDRAKSKKVLQGIQNKEGDQAVESLIKQALKNL